jgi:hypothetical protein
LNARALALSIWLLAFGSWALALGIWLLGFALVEKKIKKKLNVHTCVKLFKDLGA